MRDRDLAHEPDPPPTRRSNLAIALALALAACATAHSPGAPATADDRATYGDLAEKNDEELFAIGTAARQAGDPMRAALAFSRLADAFPRSLRARAALQEAGLAWRDLDRWDAAAERFRRLAEAYRGADADEASFLLAEALYRMNRHADARRVLDGLAARGDLDGPQIARALTQRAAIELEDGDADAAESSLGRALSTWRAAEGERAKGYYPGKAHFYLGEVYRSRLLAVKLDPSGDEAELQRELERASQLLLAAQGHYLDAIRTGEAGWAVNACARVGELYDGFYHQLVDAPLPRGLEGDLAQAYRQELRESARVLVEKAVVAYEEALSVARHTTADTAFVPRAEEALERLKRILAEGDDAHVPEPRAKKEGS